jgi:hypothetical protein
MVNNSYIGDAGTYNNLDDFASIDLDLQSLVSKFISPIESTRSMSSPNINDGFDQNPSSSESAQESRTHAFYRILGLPTITPDGKIYSPGFNPLNQSKNIKKYQDINSAIPIDVKKSIFEKESYSKERQVIFSKLSIDASILGLALATPRGQRPFMIFDRSVDSLTKKDLQQKAIPERAEFILRNYKKKIDGSELDTIINSKNLSTVTHILRPFITDPVISYNVSPKSGNATAMVAAPFLEKDDIEYEGGKYLKRPGIEFILRLRLKQQNIIEQIDKFNGVFNLNDINTEDLNLQEIAGALSNTGLGEEDINQIMYGSSMLEVYTVDSLLKTYKGLIHLYKQNIENIQKAHKSIIWIPAPNIGGPEKGSETSAAHIIPKKFLDTWEVEKKIRLLQAKSSIASNQVDIGNDLSFSDFTISEFYNVSNTFEEELQNVKNEIAQLEAQASNSLRTIEYITGEVSGLGLIDIIAIYMALWSIDINSLLGLIDDDAAIRLSKITDLKSQAVTDRVSNIGGNLALQAYKAFEDRVIDILAYGDGIYKQMTGSPLEQEGGDIVRNTF